MVRTSLPERDTACLHPEIEDAMLKWLKTRSHPAFLLIGSPGVGKTTMVYRVCKQAQFWIQEFNASHTRTGSSFRQTIMPLLIETGVSKWIHPSTPNGRAVLLDEMDGLSQGEKGGLQELLDYLKSKRNFVDDCKSKNPSVLEISYNYRPSWVFAGTHNVGFTYMLSKGICDDYEVKKLAIAEVVKSPTANRQLRTPNPHRGSQLPSDE
jgi:DNA polymerase III delta prime subunit